MRKSMISLGVMIALGAAPALAETKWGVIGQVGTLGFGVGVAAGLNESINIRAGLNAYDYDYTSITFDIEGFYIAVDHTNVETSLDTLGGFVDWFVFKGSFRLTGGVVSNGNEATLSGTPTGSRTIGDNTYTPAEVGTLSGLVDFDSTAPYLGIGWGNAAGKDKKFHFMFDLGVLLQGSAQVDLSANGTLASDPTFQADLQKLEDNWQQDLEYLELYPVLSAGIAYRFN